MKNKIKFLSPIFLLIFSSCQKKEEQSGVDIQTSIFSKIKSELKGSPLLTVSLSSLYLNGLDKEDNINIGSSSSIDLKDANLTVNGKIIPKILTSNGKTIFSTSKPKSDLNSRDDLNSLYGKDVNFNISSQDLGTITGTLRTPMLIRSKINDSENLKDISLSQDIKITWNKDEINKLPILVYIIKSHSLDNTDTKAIPQIVKQVNDNGFLYVKSSDLQIFPVGCSVDFKVVRGAYTISETSNKKQAVFYSITESCLPQVTVKQ
jgi:hypothetical protein